MNRDALLEVFDREQRIEVATFGMRREVTPAVIRFVPEPGFGGRGFISYSKLTAENVDAAISEEIATFEGLGASCEWKAYAHDTPPDLLDRLKAHGFEMEDPEAVLVLDLEEAPAAFWQPQAHDIRRITDPAGLAEVFSVHKRVWGDEEAAGLKAQLTQEMEGSGDSISFYVARVDGAPGASGWIRFHPHSSFASLWGGSTVPEQRRRGLYTALLAVRAQEARRRGYRFLTIDASPMSRPICEKHGFRFLTYAHECVWRSDLRLKP